MRDVNWMLMPEDVTLRLTGDELDTLDHTGKAIERVTVTRLMAGVLSAIFAAAKQDGETK